MASIRTERNQHQKTDGTTLKTVSGELSGCPFLQTSAYAPCLSSLQERHPASMQIERLHANNDGHAKMIGGASVRSHLVICPPILKKPISHHRGTWRSSLMPSSKPVSLLVFPPVLSFLGSATRLRQHSWTNLNNGSLPNDRDGH